MVLGCNLYIFVLDTSIKQYRENNSSYSYSPFLTWYQPNDPLPSLSSQFIMSDTQSSVHNTPTGNLPLSQAIHSVNIKSLVPYTLDTQIHNYGKWSQLFTIVLGRFDLLHHVTTSNDLSEDPAWVRENLTVLSWIFATISEDLVDMVIRPPGRQAHAIWRHLENIFSGNKASRAVHLEAAFHSLTQGDLSTHDYCHRLQQLANNLADCDAPVDDRTLVHQLVAGMNTKYHTLRTLLPALPVFPNFMQARDMLLLEERSQSVSKSPCGRCGTRCCCYLVALASSSPRHRQQQHNCNPRS